MPRTRALRATPLALACALTLAGPAVARAQQVASAGGAALARGRTLFDAQCARCHGIEGTGGVGPSLQRPVLGRAPNDTALATLIATGIDDRGMPGAWQLSPNEVSMLVAYVRSLGNRPPEVAPGDAARGEALFRGRGGCLACHVVRGTGGVIGPELTNVGAARGLAYLRRALRDPGAELPAGPGISYAGSEHVRYLLVRAVPMSGPPITGIRVNEDAFTIQVRDTGGAIHSLEKRRLRALEKLFHASLMPTAGPVYSNTEIDDIVSYLMTLRGGA